MRVEVAYACPRCQFLETLDVAPGTTAIEAVRYAGIAQRCPEIDPEQAKFGIFGQHCPPEQILSAGDRVEIYRPLRVEPKVARRQRAAGTRRGRSTGRRP